MKEKKGTFFIVFYILLVYIVFLFWVETINIIVLFLKKKNIKKKKIIYLKNIKSEREREEKKMPFHKYYYIHIKTI